MYEMLTNEEFIRITDSFINDVVEMLEQHTTLKVDLMKLIGEELAFITDSNYEELDNGEWIDIIMSHMLQQLLKLDCTIQSDANEEDTYIVSVATNGNTKFYQGYTISHPIDEVAM